MNGNILNRETTALIYYCNKYSSTLKDFYLSVKCHGRKDIYSPLGGERGEEKIENLVLSKTTLCHVQLPRRITNSELTCLLLQALVRY